MVLCQHIGDGRSVLTLYEAKPDKSLISYHCGNAVTRTSVVQPFNTGRKLNSQPKIATFWEKKDATSGIFIKGSEDNGARRSPRFFSFAMLLVRIFFVIL